MGTLPGRKPSILTVRASFFRRESTSDWMAVTGSVSVILRSSLSRVSTVTDMVNLCREEEVVRGGGLEPPHHCWRQDLNLVLLPISPPALVTGKGKRAARRSRQPARIRSTEHFSAVGPRNSRRLGLRQRPQRCRRRRLLPLHPEP